MSKRADNIFEAVKRYREFQQLLEGTAPFLIYRADTGAVLARGIYGYEAAKEKANELRKRMGLRWEQVKFRADRSTKKAAPSGGYRRYDYSARYNQSKGKRFSGVWDKHGNFIELD